MRRVVLMVLDGCGVGALPDAGEYGDQGANTLLHVCEHTPDLRLPHLERMGLGKIVHTPCLDAGKPAIGAWGMAAEKSAGKDTTVGHWEIAGLLSERPLPTYPDGFPPEVMRSFETAAGVRCIGNRAASGTAILEELGEEHLRSHCPIVYTSADSVFQIAAHEDVISPEQLWVLCRTARKILKGPHAVGRVIARPFTGKPGHFVRTANRHDFSLEPPGVTMLDMVSLAGMSCVGVGKINDIFAGRGLTASLSTACNMDGVDRTLEAMDETAQGLIFTNLVDFDMKYGHRRDVKGFAEALRELDARIPELLNRMGPEDILILTADHGCDPAHPGTDHTREHIPLLVAGQAVTPGRALGTRATFADIAATVLKYLGCIQVPAGTSMALEIYIGKESKTW